MTQLPSVMELMVATSDARKKPSTSVSPHEPHSPLSIPRISSTTSLPSAIAYGRKISIQSNDELVTKNHSPPATNSAMSGFYNQPPFPSSQRRLTEPTLYDGMHKPSSVVPHFVPSFPTFNPNSGSSIELNNNTNIPPSQYSPLEAPQNSNNVSPYGQNQHHQFGYPEYFPPMVYTSVPSAMIYQTHAGSASTLPHYGTHPHYVIPGSVPPHPHSGVPPTSHFHHPQHNYPHHLIPSPSNILQSDENNALINKRRIIKRRTRTGCLTCRKRRIKCDERKPHCFNCERSKKVCLGYEVFKKKGVSSNDEEEELVKEKVSTTSGSVTVQ